MVSVNMRPRTLRLALASMGLGAVLAGGAIGTGIAKASPETDFLDALNAGGIVIYDTHRATTVGYQICESLNTANGEAIAWNLYRNTSYADVPDIATARWWVVSAATELCPWHWHPGVRA